jgi:hypothetical protein
MAELHFLVVGALEFVETTDEESLVIVIRPRRSHIKVLCMLGIRGCEEAADEATEVADDNY